MKIRSGFVSNSSASSFIICGWEGKLEADTIKKLEAHFGTEYEEDEDYPTDAMCEFLSACKLGMAYDDEDYKNMAWGRSFCSSYNNSVDQLDFQEMQKILKEMNVLGEALEIGEAHFYLIGQR